MNKNTNAVTNNTGANAELLVTPPKIFSMSGGRYGRLNYLKAINIISLWALLLGLAMGFIIEKIGIVLAIATVIFVIRATVLRLHDMNTSGFFALLWLVPFVNIIFGIVIMVAPGTVGENRFGCQTTPSSALHIILSVIFIPLIFVLNILGQYYK